MILYLAATAAASLGIGGKFLGGFFGGSPASAPAGISNTARWALLNTINAALAKAIPGVTPAMAQGVTNAVERLIEQAEASKAGGNVAAPADMPAPASLVAPGSITGIPDTHALVSLPALLDLVGRWKAKTAATATAEPAGPTMPAGVP